MKYFRFQTGMVRHGPSHKCLMLLNKEKVTMDTCDEENEEQRWKFQNFNKET